MSAVRELRKVASQSRMQTPQSRNQMEFQDEPFTEGNHFAVYTPTKESIEKLYKSNSFKPQRYINSELIEKYFESNPQPQVEIQSLKQPSVRAASGASAMRRSASGVLTPKNLSLFDGVAKNKPTLNSYKTNSEIEALQSVPLKRMDVRNLQTLESVQSPQQTFKKTVSYPGLPWVQLDTTKKYQDPFSRNSLVKTLAAFKGTGKETVQDMMIMSRQISGNLKQTLRMQTDKGFLERAGLIPVPKTVSGPQMTVSRQGQRFIIAGNDAHTKESNLGYTRKANGTFYNH